MFSRKVPAPKVDASDPPAYEEATQSECCTKHFNIEAVLKIESPVKLDSTQLHEFCGLIQHKLRGNTQLAGFKKIVLALLLDKLSYKEQKKTVVYSASIDNTYSIQFSFCPPMGERTFYQEVFEMKHRGLSTVWKLEIIYEPTPLPGISLKKAATKVMMYYANALNVKVETINNKKYLAP